MAQVKQVGIGRKSTGTIDGITYYTLNGKTFARSTPTMPASVYNSPEAKVRQAVFKFIQQHMKHHLRTIKQTITAKTGTPCNRYYSLNKKGLNAALQTLAEQYVDGADVTITDIEGAISDYAAAHPTSIKIASKSGYQEVYLTGPWPSTITLNALSGDSTVIIIVSENGTTTTINADGSTTVVSGSNSSSSSSNGSNDSGSNSSSSGSNGSNYTGSNSGSNSGTDTGGGSTTPSNPRLTISRTGSGSSTVTANGSAVSSDTLLAASTVVNLSVTPAEGATPTATLNGNAVTLTENDGVYTGQFTMPSANATLVINSGGGSDPDKASED